MDSAILYSYVASNAAEFTIDMQDNRLPVLYVEGSPRMEYRFLRRALDFNHSARGWNPDNELERFSGV